MPKQQLWFAAILQSQYGFVSDNRRAELKFCLFLAAQELGLGCVDVYCNRAPDSKLMRARCMSTDSINKTSEIGFVARTNMAYDMTDLQKLKTCMTHATLM